MKHSSNLDQAALKRSEAIVALDVLDSPPEPEFDDLVNLAALICEVPIAFISLVDRERQWFKARIGFEPCETSLDRSICAHALADPSPGVFTIPDLTADPRTCDNPDVKGGPRLRFYAGARLTMPGGQTIGALCVLDHRPRPGLSQAQAAALTSLANQVTSLLTLRQTTAALVEAKRGEAKRALLERDADRLALQHSELRYQTLFQAIDQGFCVIEFIDGPEGPLSDYRHIEANNGCAVHTGLSDIRGKRLREVLGEEAGLWLRRFQEVLRSGRSVHFEQQLVQTGRYLDISAHRIEPADLRQVALLFTDVTERKNAEEALRRLNTTLEQQVTDRLTEVRLYRDIIQADASPILAFDHAYRVIAFNAAHDEDFFRVMGLRQNVGDVLPNLFPPDQAVALKGLMDRALAGERFVFTREFGTPGGELPTWEITYTPLRDAAGQVTGAYHHARNISERVRAERQLATTQEALRQSQKLEAVGQLTGGVAHDFNNLLTVVKSSTELLKRPGLAEAKRVRYIDAISDTVDRAAKLTGQLLAFARRQALTPEVFSAAASVRSLADMMKTLTGSRIQITTDLSASPCFVNADASQFDTALVNLLVNARDAMDGEGRIGITVTAVEAIPAIRSHAAITAPYVAIALHDTGSGISPETIDRIFEPFFTTKEIGKGTGLGLSQVFGFAKQSGGDVTVASELGIGTTFTFYLPRVAAPKRLAGANEVKAVASGHDICVLVVEDNIDVGTFAVQSLGDIGYKTVLAANAAAALAELDKDSRRFDVVFSDVMMPGMSGIELGQEIRRLYPELPVVLTSGYSHVLAETGSHGFELLHKPYSTGQLSAVLQRVARRHERA